MTIYYHTDTFNKIMRTNSCYLAISKNTEIEFSLTNMIIKPSRQKFDKLSAPFLVLPASDQTCNGMQSRHLGFGRSTKNKNINISGAKNERQKGPINPRWER